MRLSQVQPDDEELRLIFTAGFVLRDIGRLDEAETVFRGMAELVSHSELPFVALGSIQLRRGEFISAQEYCEQGLRLHPMSLYARVHRAEALLFQRRREEAEAELRDIIASHPDSPHSRTARTLLEAANLICEAQLTAENAG
jgi:tetratricopeptide (TPR) repeat protein